jgi:hypothetical protein
MTADPQRATVRRAVADLVALEGEIAAALALQEPIVAAHPPAGAAVRHFRTQALEHRDALAGHLAGLGDPRAAGATAPVLVSLLPPPGAADAALPVCAALRADYTAFHHAALGYGLLWGMAHRAYTERVPEPTHRLAEQHQRRHAAAAQEVVGLLADVLAWELSRHGQPCGCICPSCRGLGVCICTTGAQSVTVDNFAETALPGERGVRVRQLRAGGPAEQGGLRPGDAVVAVDGQDLPDVWKLNGRLEGFRAGRPVRLRIEHPTGSVREVAVRP